MPNLDCPSGNQCSNCLGSKGVWIPTFGGHMTEIELAPKKLKKMYASGGSWVGTSLFKDLQFIGFDSSKNTCGGAQAAITTNGASSDYHPVAHFQDIKFKNTDQSALFKFDSPSQGWANLADCGTFTCTGLYNVLVHMENPKFSGTPKVFGLPGSFQVTSNNRESTSAQVIPLCFEKEEWNAYMCRNEDMGVLLFESQDADRMDRNAQPIYIIDEERGFNNRLNAYMDHGWDGAYTSQKREQRFPTMIDVSRNYTIEYTGTPPQKQRFSLHSDSY